ncbi:MAG: ATP-dependent zinc protease [Woeseiaceae bacterium]|nr:ATP-dependent zinc protease [Woeseiaceae bacterium]
MRPAVLLPVVAFLAGCVAQPAVENDGSATDETLVEEPAVVLPPEPEPTVEEAVAVAAPPGYCEQLIEQLESTRPLLEGLDGSLANHAERMESLAAELARPAEPPRPMDCPQDPDSVLGNKELIGSIEWIYMNPPGEHYRARIDSGAETSSLSATKITEFERDGDDWVRFTFNHEAAETSVEIEQPILRTVLVRQPGVSETDRRVVIELDIRLGERLQRTEFALTDRSRMTYPVLLGRAFLLDLYVIDVARSYTHPRFEAP